MRKRRIAFIASVLCLVAIGLFSAPAGALATPTVTVGDNASTIVTGGTLVFTVTVSGSGPTPTGLVTWTGTAPGGSAISCPTSTLDGSGGGDCTITDAVAGTYSATASYGGDGVNYGPNTGSDDSAGVGVAPSSTMVTDNAGSVSTGGTLVFIATVTGPGGTPAGTVDLDGGDVYVDNAAHRRAGHLLDQRRSGQHRLHRHGCLHRYRRQLQRLERS